MRLYIGKNHSEDTFSVQSIFRLAGSDEDALTSALGFLLAYDRSFCSKLIRRLRVARRLTLEPDYSVHLQEVTDSRFGRRDIVIEDSRVRIVLEAKIGGAEPTVGQLLKYGTEHKLWKQYETRGIVALTQVKLAAVTRKIVEDKLWEQGIRFINMQWSEVVDLALGYKPSNDSEVSRYLLDQFIRYIRSDYQMGYYDAEILIQDVNPLNAKIFEEGWMYVTTSRDKKAPLYFSPYFTKQGKNTGISMISRVMDTEIVVLAEKQDVSVNAQSAACLQKWRNGLDMVKKEYPEHMEARLLYLDCPITLWKSPLLKKTFNAMGPLKQIPNQIPKGFSLRFDELLSHGLEYSKS